MTARSLPLLCTPLLTLSLAASLGAAPPSDHWPQFRGVGARGVGSGAPPVSWDVVSGKNIKWKVAIPGLAHSSPIVWGDRVFLTTATSEDQGSVGTGFMDGTGDSAKDSKPWAWKVLCLDRADGRILWERTAHEGMPKLKRHLKATHANTTPATDGKHVVAFFGSEGLYCYDADGTLLWKKDLGVLHAGPYNAQLLEWGFASSPVIYEDQVIVQCDALNTNFWAAFDIITGREVMRVKREDVATWSTPTVIEHGGRPQVVLNGYHHIGAYDLATGKETWKLSHGGDVPVPTPFLADGAIVISNGHNGNHLFIVEPSATGDITPPDKDDKTRKPKGLRWWHTKAGSYMPTPVARDGRLYVGNDRGILAVGDLASGELIYRERISDSGGTYSASPVIGGGHLYLTCEDGDIHVVKLGPKFDKVATNGMYEVCMATPAISRGDLFIRTQQHLVCIGKK